MTKKAGTKKSVLDPLNPDWIKGLVELKESWVAKAIHGEPKKADGWARIIVCHETPFSTLAKDLGEDLSPGTLKTWEKANPRFFVIPHPMDRCGF